MKMFIKIRRKSRASRRVTKSNPRVMRKSIPVNMVNTRSNKKQKANEKGKAGQGK